MKYKCIKPYYQYNLCIMEEGDIIVLEGTKLYNITKKIYTDYIYNIEEAKQCLEVFTDESYSTESVIKTDTDKFEDITKIMIDTFTKKNHDYGNSFEQSLDEEGLAASRIRIGDKWNRFKQLSKGAKAQVNDESLRDTLLDMAVYSILTIMWIDKNTENGKN